MSDRDQLPPEWRRRLRESGFRDIESRDGIIARKQLEGDRGERYMARRAFLESHTFADELERRVWEMHTEEVSNREITRQLAAEGLGVYRQQVDRFIREAEAAMRAQAIGRGRRGRPKLDDGRGDGCVVLKMRLNDVETGALMRIKERFGRTYADIIRSLMLELARKI